jgi:hypothetical protein
MDEKEKKKAEQGPAWWYEPRGSKVREYLLDRKFRILIPIGNADGILSSVSYPDWIRIQLGLRIRILLGIRF